MSCNIFSKIKFCIKTNWKLPFLHFSQPQNSKKHDFSMVFHQKWAVTPQKIMFFSFFICIQAKNEKNHHFHDVPFLQFWVHLDPILIKISRFHTLQQEKLVTKVIISLSWTKENNFRVHLIRLPRTRISRRITLMSTPRMHCVLIPQEPKTQN